MYNVSETTVTNEEFWILSTKKPYANPRRGAIKMLISV